jgi:hypothetical protein
MFPLQKKNAFVKKKKLCMQIFEQVRNFICRYLFVVQCERDSDLDCGFLDFDTVLSGIWLPLGGTCCLCLSRWELSPKRQ